MRRLLYEEGRGYNGGLFILKCVSYERDSFTIGKELTGY
jgi:hypothetical protein